MELPERDDLLLVSALIRPRPSVGAMMRSPAEYLAQFTLIAETGLQVVLFLDRTLVGEVSYPNVTVVPITLSELWTFRAAAGLRLTLPAGRSVEKDTGDYLLIVNAKTELMTRAIAMRPEATTVAWVDCGLFKVFRDPARAQRRLAALRADSHDAVIIPGCWTRMVGAIDKVNWRFCGGLIWGTPPAVKDFAAAHERCFQSLLPNLTWEVNVWARMEVEGLTAPRWYQADHDDSILAYSGAPE